MIPAPLNNFISQPKKLPYFPAHTSTSPSTQTISTNTLPSISLQKCSTLLQAHQLHAQIFKWGAMNDPLLLTKLISLYALSDFDCFDHTLRILSSIPHRNPIIWKTLIHRFSLSSIPEQSILLFIRMLEEEEPFSVNTHVFPSVLKACARIFGVFEGTQIHSYAVKLNIIADPFVGNALMVMYLQCGKLSKARCVFDNMSERSVVSWNIIIMAYDEAGHWEDVKSLFWSMVELSTYVPDSISLVRMSTACTRSADFDSGKRVRRYVEENGVEMSLNLGNALMNMYVKMGDVSEAHQLFDQLPHRDVVSWTTLVSAYVGLGCLGLARKLFDSMPECNIVAWNAMIAGYVLNGCFQKALLLFKDMLVLDVKPDKATFVSVLRACVGLEDLFYGRMIHGYITKGSIEITLDLINSFIGLYSKCNSMNSAELLFKGMPIKNEISWTLMMVGYVKFGAKEVALDIFNQMAYKDIVSWNALIAVFVQCNYLNEALDIFQEMLRSKICPNSLTLVSTLSACARLGALELGKWIHAYVERNNIEMDCHLSSSLIDMYAKCGRIELSLEVFNKMSTKDLLTWSSMISGLAMHGRGKLALELFEQMLDDGVQPDGITFLGVLSACSHAGLVNEGRQYFSIMTQVYNIPPSVEHYSCMVDLLGRNGLLREAKDFVEGIPRTSKGKDMWGALLGASRVHGDVELAEYAAKRILEVDPRSSGAFVLLSNTYATASQWDDVEKVRNTMKGKLVQKLPGCSSIEVNGVVHEFFVRDNSHPQCDEIYMMIHELEKQMESINQTNYQY